MFDFRNNTHWVSLFQKNNSLIFQTGVSCLSAILFYFTLLAILKEQLANIPDRGFLFLRNTLLLYSLSPYSQTERQTESQIHLLCVGWRNLFSSCAIVSVFCSGGKQVLVLHNTYVLRVPYSCGVELVFLILAGNCFWCYLRTQCTIQLCGCVSFFVVARKLIQYEFSC